MQSSDLKDEVIFERDLKTPAEDGNPTFEAVLKTRAKIEEQSGGEPYVASQTKRRAAVKAVFTFRKTPLSIQITSTMRIVARGFEWEIISPPREHSRDWLKLEAERGE